MRELVCWWQNETKEHCDDLLWLRIAIEDTRICTRLVHVRRVLTLETRRVACSHPRLLPPPTARAPPSAQSVQISPTAQQLADLQGHHDRPYATKHPLGRTNQGNLARGESAFLTTCGRNVDSLCSIAPHSTQCALRLLERSVGAGTPGKWQIRTTAARRPCALRCRGDRSPAGGLATRGAASPTPCMLARSRRLTVDCSIPRSEVRR